MRIQNIAGAFIFFIYAQYIAFGQTSFWTNSVVPGTPESDDTASVTVGLKFYSDVDGSVTGLRFYKSPRNVGTHVGNLWSSTGTQLASVTFEGETASGWQQAIFSSPVSIAANTTYIISYLAPQGRYADDEYYSWSTLTAPPLHVSGSSPGVYAYGSTPLFPTGTWHVSNYWVAPVFVAQPTGSSTGSNTFWTTSTIPGTPEVSNDSASVTLGLKFYSDVPGSVTGIRFYKGPHNTGAHIGTLWSNSGSKLAEITFSGETASGWQQVSFATPVSIAAQSTYIISYLAPVGYYADDQNYSWATLSAAPLHASGSSPGVYAYGSTTTFPTGTWNSTNYWVDLVFAPSTSPQPLLYTISGVVSGSAATLTLSGSATGTTSTDATGKYIFSGLPNGAYVVAPSQSGYAFTPSTTSVTISGSAVTGVNFTATAVPVPVSHNVTLSWTASTSNVIGYNVYRGSSSGGPYAKLNGSLITGTSYLDSAVSSGQTYFYVATAVDSAYGESQYSNEAAAPVPTP